MECPHLHSAFDAGAVSQVSKIAKFCCKECEEDRDPWFCLSCASLNCGRYINGHGLKHYEENPTHTVVIACESLQVFCYSCDDFTYNDVTMPEIVELRNHLLSKSDESTLISEDSNASNASCVSIASCASDGSNNSADVGTKLVVTNKRHSSSPHDTENNTSTVSLENAVNKKSKIDVKSLPHHLRSSGLRNLGNTCFMNAVLQSLSNLPQFCRYFKDLPALDEKLGKVKNGRKTYQTRRTSSILGDDLLLSEEIRKILIELWAGSKSAISPDSLFNVIWKVVPRFRGFQQQDAHEFLCYILDRLNSELLNILPQLSTSASREGDVVGLGQRGARTTIVTAIFGGLLQSEVTCLTCRSESKKHDPFLDLSVNIPCSGVNGNSKMGPNQTQQTCCLEECLKSFTELEVLSETELYHCSTCKKKQRSTKKFSIRRLPNILCIHLKRFRWCNSFRQKITTNVTFPLRGLDMSVYMLENMPETRGISSCGNLYDLAAIIVHHGTGAGSGHYTAYAFHDGYWYHFNDSSVSLANEETVSKCKAYILFYIRRKPSLPSVSDK